MKNSLVVASLLSTLVVSAPTAGQTPIPPEDVVSVSPEKSINAPADINIYLDHAGELSGPTGSAFATEWESGDWAINIKVRDAAEVRELESMLSVAPIEGRLATAKDRRRFLGGVRIVITSGPKGETKFFVNGCSFVRNDEPTIRAVTAGLQRYFFAIASSSNCVHE